MINKYLFFCVNILAIGNHVWSTESELISKNSNSKEDEQIDRMEKAANLYKELKELKQYGHNQHTPSITPNRRDWATSPAPTFLHKSLPLFNAIDKNNLEKVKEIIDDVDTNNWLEARNAYGNTPLLAAVCGDKIEIARYLIAMGANVNAYGEGFPIAYLVKSLEMLTLLIEAGVDINALDELEQSILDRKWRSLDQYEFDYSLELIKKGARFHKIMKEISIYNGVLGKTLMYKALLFAFVENSNKELAQHFLEFCKIQEIDLCSKDVSGNTLLHHLIESEPAIDRNAKARLLLEYCPELANMQNENGDTPLHCAIIANDNALVSLLIRYGVDVFIPNKSNFTACNLALNDPRFLEILFRYGSVEDIFKNRGIDVPKNTINKIENKIEESDLL